MKKEEHTIDFLDADEVHCSVQHLKPLSHLSIQLTHRRYHFCGAVSGFQYRSAI